MPQGIDTSTAQQLAVAATSAKFTNAMARSQQYVFISNTNCWITVTVTGGAASIAGAGCWYVPANTQVWLKNQDDVGATTNSFVHVIRDSADGKACLGIFG